MDSHKVFISNAAHQLRNPAAAVQAVAEALRDAKTESEREQRLSELLTAAQNSAKVTEQILSLERLNQASSTECFGRFNLGQLIEKICAESGATILKQGKDFELDIADRNLQIFTDEFFIGEAIRNLLDNAIRHGGADLSRIHVRVGVQEDGFAAITVSDDGVGMIPADTDKAFSRFKQLQPSMGSGLGLAIAHEVAVKNGGKLIINQVKKGASLTLLLPIAAK